MYILASPFTKTFDTLGLLYFVPEFFQSKISLGIIIEAPIWSKMENAVVLELVLDLDVFMQKHNITITKSKIRSITGIVTQTQYISETNIHIVQYISTHYFTQIHNALNLFFPTIVRKKILSLDQKFFDRLRNTVEARVGAGDLMPWQSKRDSTYFNTLSTAQEKAYLEIQQAFYAQEHISSSIYNAKDINPLITLLYWITGSGKTEIYIKLISDNLQKNKQSLLLIPEIILNNQIGDTMKQAFWDDVIIINSSITDTKKAQYFADIFSWTAKIIVGTRSALFYPYQKLGLIIMDEEHDNSYNSDSAPRYKTTEIIEKMLELDPSMRVLLWSGTPSINSMYKALKKEWNLVNLLEKYTGNMEKK